MFFNLDELPSAVDHLLSKYVSDLERALRAATDSGALGAPTSGATSLLGVPGGARALSGLGQGAGGWQVVRLRQLSLSLTVYCPASIYV